MELMVYVVIISDRHEDIDVEVFSEKEDAISRAKEIVEERMSDGYEGEDDDDIADESVLFFEQYSTEDDYVCVVEKPLRP